MYPPLLLFCLFSISNIYGQAFERIHKKAIVVDTHNDILMKAVSTNVAFDKDLTGKTSSDLARWKKGGLDVQIFSVYCDGDTKDAFAYANREMDSLDAVIKRNRFSINKGLSTIQLKGIVYHQKIAAMFGVEGGHMIENDLEKITMLYNRGARYLTLTHNISPDWATSAADETTKPNLPKKGLTPFGEQVVAKLNELGMLIDVSHAGDQTFWDVIKLSKKPIIASHSSVYSLVPHRRNLKDEQIKAIAKNGGVIQINFNPGFIDNSFAEKEKAFLKIHSLEKDSLMKAGMDEFYAVDFLYKKYATVANAMRPSLELLMQHFDYIIKLVGVNYVGIGSDFDGIHLTPQQLDDVTCYPIITKALHERGYSRKDIAKILGGNFLRVLKANEGR